MKLHLRPFTENDLEALVNLANNPKIAANLTDQFPYPYTREHGVRFIEMVTQHEPTRIFALEFEGDFCGAVGLHPQTDIMRKNAELGYWVAEPFWGKGIATHAIRRMIDYGFQNFDIVRIFARPYGPNIASQKVLEKAGFKLEARLSKTIYKNEEFLDELIYAIRK
ncbi:MAG: GNAT family N-acetyltransferase [Crocinitomicaceae bacterium]|nr:GNAT family N-acetyltransferase [Crocinitomicaceae bacterium]